MKAAAMFIVVAGITSLLIYLNSSPAYITITSPAGKVTAVDFPDGSRGWINASTVLQYPKDFEQNRQIKLSGEGYFEVKRDTNHPFSVEAAALKTTVLGTSFNISGYPSENLMSVSVITGRVGVSAYGEKEKVLTASMHVQLDKQSRRLTVGTTDTTAVLAWKAGRLQFYGKTFDVIAKRLEQWYGYQILLATPGSGRCRYYMTFRNTLTLEELLAAMSEITEMKFDINHQKKTVTLSGKECR
jgi:ferric-dicitrate binding protein FerR (iron transport regulator)